MQRYAKAGIVVGGYVAAFVIATGAVAVHEATLNQAEASAAGGMYAIGDLALFVIVFVGLSLIPTVAALFFLLSRRRD